MLNYFWNEIVGFFVQQDKVKHFSLSAIILVFDFWIRYLLISKGRKTRSVVYAIRDTFMIGIFKEIADVFGFWTPDMMDILGDVLWFLLPIYLYFLYQEAFHFKRKNLFRYGDDVIRANVIYGGAVVKETLEGAIAWLKYIVLLFLNLIKWQYSSRKMLFWVAKKKNKEIYEAKVSFRKWIYVARYTIKFFSWSIIDFLIDFLIMPFYILGKTIYFFFKSINLCFYVFKNDILSKRKKYMKK